MKTRIISGLAMMPLLFIIYLGGYYLMAAGLVVALVGLYEFYRGFYSVNIRPSYAIGALSCLGLYAIALFRADHSFYMIWLFASVLACLLYLFDIENRKLEDGMATITGIVYVLFFSFHIVLIDMNPAGKYMIWLALLSAFGTDIFAYFTGMAIGKHKLCPKISPKKSVEGAIGGIVGSMAICGGFGAFVSSFDAVAHENIAIHCILIGFVASVVSQFGDLTASVFKRKMGIKDYGKLIPGHGGILDRFDSVLFTAPVIYYYIMIFMN